MVKVGDTIKILSLEGEPNSPYEGKEGEVLGFNKDCDGEERMFGTWGGIFIYLDIDKYEIVK